MVRLVALALLLSFTVLTGAPAPSSSPILAQGSLRPAHTPAPSTPRLKPHTPPTILKRPGKKERERNQRTGKNQSWTKSRANASPDRPRASKPSHEDRNWGFTEAGLSVLEDPEVGLPTWAEFEEIVRAYEKGETLTFRQSVWLDALTDPFSRTPTDLSLRVPPPPANLTIANIRRSQPTAATSGFPCYHYRPIIGCGDFANCSDCRKRYMGDPLPWTPAPPPRYLQPLLPTRLPCALH